MRFILTTDFQVEKFKQSAKKLRRSNTLPHREALDKVAKANGYNHWHHVTICHQETVSRFGDGVKAGTIDPISYVEKEVAFILGCAEKGDARLVKIGSLVFVTATTPEDSQRVRDCGRMLEQLQWLVSSLLRLARLDAGVVRLERHCVDASALVKAAQDPLAVAADLAGVTFQARVEPGCSFMGDAAWTREALTNVLKNCVEHTPAGGTVRITAREDTVACRICVEDTGPGIAEKDLPHVFERFYHGAGNATRRGEDVCNPSGVGIGLSLSRALLVAQGAQITASNVSSTGGARFDLVFPKVTV